MTGEARPGDLRGQAALAGRIILVAEDEFLIADDLCERLGAAGAQVLGPAPSPDAVAALAANAARIDLAILDINLGGKMAFGVAEQLAARGVRLLFATGYDASIIPAALAMHPHSDKPVSLAAVAGLLSPAD